jgi:two-component system cell cycle sensor histidine kinase/response regulator CckA
MTAIVAVGLVGLVVLLLIRLMATVLENMRLLQAEAAEERLRQAEKMGAVSRLAGGIAHEFNNLMTTVMGHAELGAEDLPDDSPAREDFARILEAGSRAAGLTNQLLAFSGQQLTRPMPMDLAEFVRHRGTILAARAPGGATTGFAIAAAPVRVLGDARQLGLVLDQLVGNAFAAMPAGGALTLAVTTEVLEAPLETPYLSVPAGRYAVLAVTDTGVGIPAADLPRIFDPFFSTRPMHAAAGLGLASVYGIVAAHDGGIAVESTPGQGTTVRLYFPIARDGG